MVGDLRAAARYARGLGSFLREHPSDAEAEELVAHHLRERTAAFVRVMERAVYAKRGSPYRRLLDWAGIELGDVERSVRDVGVEATLERLYDAGVYVTSDELAGRRPIGRAGLELPVRAEDFDNPLAAGDYVGRSGGSGGAPRRMRFELALMAHEACYLSMLIRSAGLADRTLVLWRPVPPGLAGMNNILRYARLAKTVERWFTQYPLRKGPRDLRYAAFTEYTLRAGRRAGLPLPWPEYVPLDRPEIVADWLATRVAAGDELFFNAPVSAAVRVCAGALDRGLDISGTVFRLGGEPYTEARERTIEAAGCAALSQYAISELGWVGLACADPVARDDMHVLDDKLALIRRERAVDPTGTRVGELVFTTLLPSCPKLLLNAHSGDHAALEERSCGCRFGELGFVRHLHTVRSHEKLTSEGLNFAGADLLMLVEEVLPGRFGGRPDHYQLVERERDGIPEVDVLASPRVGSIDEDELRDAVLAFLGRGGDERRMMARVFAEAGTVRVLRGEPNATAAGKILPLHVAEDAASPRP